MSVAIRKSFDAAPISQVTLPPSLIRHMPRLAVRLRSFPVIGNRPLSGVPFEWVAETPAYCATAVGLTKLGASLLRQSVRPHLSAVQHAHCIRDYMVSNNVWSPVDDEFACVFDAADAATLGMPGQLLHMVADTIVDRHGRQGIVDLDVIKERNKILKRVD